MDDSSLVAGVRCGYVAWHARQCGKSKSDGEGEGAEGEGGAVCPGSTYRTYRYTL